MAGIPMYYGTSTFGEIEAKRARQRMDVLKTEEAEIDLDDYKKSKELMKKSAIKKLADSQTNAPSPSSIPTMSNQKEQMPSYQTQDKDIRQAPTDMDQAPTEYATAPTTDVNLTSPFGTYEQRGAESPADMPYGFGGAIPKDYKSLDQVLQTQMEPSPGQEQPPTEGQPSTQGQPQEQPPVDGYNQLPPPQETAPPPVNNIATRAKKATLDFTDANDQVEAAYNLAESFKREGLLKPYYKQLEVAGKLEETRTMAQSRRINATKDLMEITGRLAGGYVEVAKRTDDPVELERAWQSTLMILEMNGIPAGDLRGMTDPRARLAIAEKYADASMGAAKKLELMQKGLRLTLQNDRANNEAKRKEKLANETITNGAAKRELNERKYEKEELTSLINAGQKQVTLLQTDLKLKTNKLLKLREGNLYIDSSGVKMDDDERAKEVPLLEQEVANLETEIALEEDKLKGYIAKLKPKAKVGVTTTTTNEVPKESKLPQEMWDKAEAEGFTRENQKELVGLLQEDQTKDNLEYIKKVFKTKHPGLNFDDYFAINTAKFK